MGYEPDKFQTRRKNIAPYKGYANESQGHLIFLNGKNGEAVLAIAQLADGKTAIALNILENGLK